MKKEGFTLIEVLVVIAIIFIVSAIILPVFVQAKRRAHEAVCVSNMRQVYMSMSLYYGDGDDWEKPIPGIDVLQAYARSKEVFACPQDRYVKEQAGLGFPVKLGYSWDSVGQQRYVNYRISYAFIGDYDEQAEFWRPAQERSPIGVLACQWHGHVTRPIPSAITTMNPPLDGKILRIVFDGHLHVRKSRVYASPFSVIDMFYRPWWRIPPGGLELR